MQSGARAENGGVWDLVIEIRGIWCIIEDRALLRRAKFSFAHQKRTRKVPATFEAREARTRGCSPLVTPKKLSRCKNASRFAKRIFLHLSDLLLRSRLYALAEREVQLKRNTLGEAVKRRNVKKVQQRRPPPAADTGRSCWGRGQQDTSDTQGTKWSLGTATRLSEAASFFPFRLPLWGLKGASSP